ncbi:MAG TPA: hypothetical protein GX707_15210 [Epulopiscium sp.]|nr:hypothetical protein [Candidatus Epulonipiscium sp.]
MILKANSWTITTNKEAVKELYKSASYIKGQEYPKKIRFLLELEDIVPGENRRRI